METPQIQPSALTPPEGHETLASATVVDFWRWALGDLRMNNARGHLAEFLVARSLGDRSPTRIEWGPYDVKAADGTLIEVKATGRLQSWATKKLSPPTWSFKSVRAHRVWSDPLGAYVEVDPATRVHVWVFALQTATDPNLYDPLSITQWEFRVMPHSQLLAANQTSARLSFLDRLGIKPVSYDQLPRAVATARRQNDQGVG